MRRRSCRRVVIGKTGTFAKMKYLKNEIKKDIWNYLLKEVLDVEKEDTEEKECDSTAIENRTETHPYLYNLWNTLEHNLLYIKAVGLFFVIKI